LEDVNIQVLCNPQFTSSDRDIGFVLAVSLEEDLARTLRYEFMEDNSDKRMKLSSRINRSNF